MVDISLITLATSWTEIGITNSLYAYTGENQISLYKDDKQLLVLELKFYSEDFFDKFPYQPSTIDFVDDRPIDDFIREINIKQVAVNSTNEQQNEIAFDPMISEYLCDEPPLPSVQIIDWSPVKMCDETGQQSIPVLSALTTFGALRLYTHNKRESSQKWRELPCAVDKFFRTEVCPPKVTPEKIKTFEDFKSFKNSLWITAFTWQKNIEKPTMYLATASGFIVSIIFENNFGSIRESWSTSTTMDHICYITVFHEFILVSNIFGVIKIYRACSSDSPDFTAQVIEAECLWKTRDRLSCRKAIFQRINNSTSNLVLCVKGAFLLTFILSQEGKIIFKTKVTIDGLPILEFEQIRDNEFLVFSMTGTAAIVQLLYPNETELIIEKKFCKTDLDIENYQILSVAPSANKSLWTFIASSKELASHLKVEDKTTQIIVCKLNLIDPLDVLLNTSAKSFDILLDCMATISLDIFNELEKEKYASFTKQLLNNLPGDFDRIYLRKLHIHSLITRTSVKHQEIMLKNIKKTTILELNCLKLLVPMTYILCELKYLGSKPDLTEFQKLAAGTMVLQFNILLNDFFTLRSDDNEINGAIGIFAAQLSEEFSMFSFHKEIKSTEKCVYCGEDVKPETLMCSMEHKVLRCCVSFLQVTQFEEHVCKRCNAVALPKDKTQELLPPGEILNCTYCGFALQNVDETVEYASVNIC